MPSIPKVSLNLRLTPETYAAMLRAVAAAGMSQTAWLERVIQAACNGK